MEVKILNVQAAISILKQLPYPFCEEYIAFERSRGFGYYIICDTEEKIFIPLKVSKRQIFYVGVFTHAPVAISGSISAEKERDFVNAATALSAKQFKCVRIEPGSTISVFQSYPDGAKAVELGLFSVGFDKTEDEIFAAFNSTYRNEIRNAEKTGIEIRYGKSELPAFYDCYADTHKRQGAAYEPLQFFEGVFNALGEEKVLCATAYVNGVADAAVFLIYTDYAGYYMYAGSAAKTQLKGSTKKILWDCMRLMKQRGTRQFILGGARHKNVAGTKFEGIQNFKRRFGAQVTDGYIWKKDLNIWMCTAYDLLFWLKCRLSGSAVPKDIIDSQL